MKELKVNEEFKNLIPPLTVEEKTELEKSLTLFGCRDKIVTWNGYIIDGHNRYELCVKNNIEFRTLSMDYEFEDQEEVKQWIIKNQFARRNISAYQRSSLALKLKESIAKKARENKIAAVKKADVCNPKKQNSFLPTLAETKTDDETTVLPKLTERSKEEIKVVENPVDTREQILNGQISMEDIRKEQEGEN